MWEILKTDRKLKKCASDKEKKSSGYNSDDEWSSESQNGKLNSYLDRHSRPSSSYRKKSFKPTIKRAHRRKNNALFNDDFMTKYLNNSTEYGSFHPVTGSKEYFDCKKKKFSLTDLLTIDQITKTYEKNKRLIFASGSQRKASELRESIITYRLKLAVEKIQNLAREKHDIDSIDSDDSFHITLPDVEEEELIPCELNKTIFAFFIMLINFIISLTALAIVHEYVPDFDGPLPDVVLSNVPEQKWALNIAEYLIMISVISTGIVLCFHKHRCIVFRRVFLITGLLYLLRAVTMSVTILPAPSATFECSPKLNHTDFATIAKRVLHLMSGLGLSVIGKHVYCGDYMYSGHTVILVLCYLFICEYTPKMFFIVHWLFGIAALCGISMVLLAHGHYTLDVIIAYFITTRVFWIYHTMASIDFLAFNNEGNFLAKSWTFRIFQYFEKNVKKPLPCQYHFPIKFHR